MQDNPSPVEEVPKKKHRGGFKKGDFDNPNRYRGGRSWANKPFEDKPAATYRDLGRIELVRLFRKIKPHTKDAVQVMAALMMKESADDNIRLKAALSFLAEYRQMCKAVYDSDEEINPESEVARKPAAVLHLQVINNEKKLSDTALDAEAENILKSIEKRDNIQPSDESEELLRDNEED